MASHRPVGVRKPRGPRKETLDPALDYAYTATAKAEPGNVNGMIEQHIVTQVIDAAQTNGSFDPATRQLIAGRIKHFLRETGDPAMVQFVLLETVREQGEHFIPLKHFSPGSFEHMRWRLGYPEGAWKYALWADQLDDRALRTSAYYWLDRWVDRLPEIIPGSAEQDPLVLRCRVMLEKLYNRDMVESLEW